MAQTKLTNLVNPQVMADLVDKKLTDNMVFAPLCEIDTTLVGRPGDTLTFPYFSYIGAATVIGEGSEITPALLQASTTSATVEKLCKAVEITDEGALSGNNDPLDQAAYQVGLSIADALDGKVLGVLNGITGDMCYTASTSSIAVDDINNALEKFGEDVLGQNVLVVPPSLYTVLRKTKEWLPASMIAAEAMVKGVVGEVFGCQVIISNRLKSSGNAFIVKPGALRLVMKRDTNIEADRDILKKTTVISSDKHVVTYLYNGSKAIKITHA